MDRDLLDTIKAHFARKSSVQLQEIVRANDPSRWSPEAIAAAEEVLQERLAGRAPEPEVPVEDPPPPPEPLDPYSLGFLALGALAGLGGFGIRLIYRVDYGAREPPDRPMPFGPKTAWLAIDTTDTAAVATALGLQETRAATWADGIAAAYRSSVFVTPPLADWTLAVGTALFPPDRAEAFIKPLVERLSQQFGEAQYFGTHRDVGLQLWARARHGRLVRGRGWLGQRALVLWDEGALTPEERDLGLSSDRPPVIEPARETGITSQPLHRPADAGPDEAAVMQLASLWSIDPTALDDDFWEPATGLLGKPPEDRDAITPGPVA